MHPHGAGRFLRGMPRVPLLLGSLDTAVLHEAAVVMIVKWLQGPLPTALVSDTVLPPGP